MRRAAWIGTTLTIPILALAQTTGIELYKNGKFAEAAQALSGEVERSPEDVQALSYLGLARVFAGDPSGALEPLNKAVEIDASCTDAHYGLGLAYVKLKKLDKGISELQSATKLDPDHAYARYYLGMAYNQAGKKDLAIPYLRRFLELAPNAPEAPAVRSFLSKT
jgi:tetratricopeptide (TPR) repeat protein